MYYSAYQPKTASNKRKLASGKLFYSYTNNLKKYKLCGPKSNVEENNIDIENELLDVSNDENIRLLKTSIQCFSLLREYWENSFNARNQILKSSKTFQEYFSVFPSLLQDKGFEFLLFDFDKQFGESAFYSKWSKLEIAIIELFTLNNIEADYDLQNRGEFLLFK